MARFFGKGRGRTRELPNIRAFESRTEVWQEAGLGAQIDRVDAKRARREALLLLLAIAGVVAAFVMRDTLFPDAGKPLRYVVAALLALLGWGLARTVARGLAPTLLRRMDPGTAGTTGFLIRLVTIVIVVIVALRIAGRQPGGARRRRCLHRDHPRTRGPADPGPRVRRSGPAHRPPVPGRRPGQDPRRRDGRGGRRDRRVARALLHDADQRSRPDADPEQRPDDARGQPDRRARRGRADGQSSAPTSPRNACSGCWRSPCRSPSAARLTWRSRSSRATRSPC